MEGEWPWAFGAACSAVQQHSVELCLGDGQTFRVETAGSAGNWWAGRSSDMVSRVMYHFAVDFCWRRESRKFLQEAVHGRAFCYDLHSRDWWVCSEAWSGQWSDPVEQAVVSAVDHESVMRQQVHTDDRELYIYYYKTPREVTAQSQVQVPRCQSVSGDSCTIGIK